MMLMRLIAAGMIWLCCAVGVHAANVLIINSYHADYTWSKSCLEGLKAKIDKQHNLTYIEMDTKHVPAEQFQFKADKAWHFFEKMRPDLVVTMDDNALKFLGERIANTGTPVVFMGVNHNPNRYFSNQYLPDNVSGMLERRLIAPSLETIGSILGSTPEKILFIMDEGVTSQAIIDSMFSGKHTFRYRNKTIVEAYLTNQFTEWKHKIKNAKKEGYAAIIVTNMFIVRDTNKKLLAWDKTLKWTAKNSPIPVFSDIKIFISNEYAIGGVVISSHDQGEGAAKKVNAILAGAKKSSVSIPSKYEYFYSRSGLARWGLTLPKRIAKKATLID